MQFILYFQLNPFILSVYHQHSYPCKFDICHIHLPVKFVDSNIQLREYPYKNPLFSLILTYFCLCSPFIIYSKKNLVNSRQFRQLSLILLIKIFINSRKLILHFSRVKQWIQQILFKNEILNISHVNHGCSSGP